MGVKFPKTGVTGSCELLYGCWELNWRSSARAASTLNCRATSQLPAAPLLGLTFLPQTIIGLVVFRHSDFERGLPLLSLKMLCFFISARLPFKRLNLVPKEKVEDTSPKAAVEDKVPDLQLSLDTLENRCHTGSPVSLSPKLVSGQGPIDSYLRATIKPMPSVVIVDLTENSSDIPDSPECPSELSPDAVSVAATVEGPTKQQGPSSAELGLQETPSDLPGHMEEEPGSPGDPKRTDDCQAGLPQSFPELTPGSRTCSTKELSGWSKAGSLLFIEKVPMVVLEDILATKPSHTSLPMMSLDRSVTSESEVLESCPEDDSTLSHSSISSSSPTSSPEGLSSPPAQNRGTSPNSTPMYRVSTNPQESQGIDGAWMLFLPGYHVVSDPRNRTSHWVKP